MYIYRTGCVSGVNGWLNADGSMGERAVYNVTASERTKWLNDWQVYVIYAIFHSILIITIWYLHVIEIITIYASLLF